MAKVFDTNRTVSNFGDAVYRLVSHLDANGWTIEGAGDGTSYSNAASTYFSQGAMNGSGNSGAAAWVRISHDSTGHEFVFARGGSSNYTAWVVAYSKSATFTGGSPSGIQAPTATDQQFLLGNSSITNYIDWINTSHTAGTFHVNICAETSSPYGFYMWVIETGLGRSTRGGHIVWDPLQNTSPAGGTDPYIIYCPKGSATAGTCFHVSASASATANSLNNGASGIYGYTASATFAQLTTITLANYGITGGTNVIRPVASSQTMMDGYASTRDVCLPFIVCDADDGTQGRIKGTTTFMQQSIFQQSSRSQGSMLDGSGTADLIYAGPDGTATQALVVLPWNGGSWTG